MKMIQGIVATLTVAFMVAAVSTVQARTVVDSGHWDVRLSYAAGDGWSFDFYDESFTIPLDEGIAGDDVSALAKVNTTGETFLGVGQGQTFYEFSSGAPAPELDLGWSISAPDIVPWVRGGGPAFKWARIELDGVTVIDGNSDIVFAMYAGPSEVFMSTAPGYSAPQEVFLADTMHSHFNWSFSHLGIYDVNFTVTGWLDTDGAGNPINPVSDEFSVRMNVGMIPEPGIVAAVFGLIAGGLVWSSRRRKMVGAGVSAGE